MFNSWTKEEYSSKFFVVAFALVLFVSIAMHLNWFSVLHWMHHNSCSITRIFTEPEIYMALFEKAKETLHNAQWELKKERPKREWMKEIIEIRTEWITCNGAKTLHFELEPTNSIILLLRIRYWIILPQTEHILLILSLSQRYSFQCKRKKFSEAEQWIGIFPLCNNLFYRTMATAKLARKCEGNV